MKTPMQEFIKWGDKMMRDYPMKLLGFGQAIDKAQSLLEREKQLIIDAYEQGQKDTANGFYIKSGEAYYNKLKSK